MCACVTKDRPGQEIEKDELVQAKDRELAQAQQRLREKVNSVNYIIILFHLL